MAPYTNTILFSTQVAKQTVKIAKNILEAKTNKHFLLIVWKQRNILQVLFWGSLIGLWFNSKKNDIFQKMQRIRQNFSCVISFSICWQDFNFLFVILLALSQKKHQTIFVKVYLIRGHVDPNITESL